MINPKQIKVVPPIQLATLKDYAQKIFEPIRRGENVSAIWVAMAGRRIRHKFIISYPEFFKKEIGDIDKYLLVYVEPLELTEESNAGYIKLLINSIIEACTHKTNKISKKSPVGKYSPSEMPNTYPQLLERVERLIEEITSQGLEVILFLGEFDEFEFANSVLYNNLKSLWAKSEKKLHFVFLVLEDVTLPEAIKKYGELNELLLQNIVYVPLVEKEDVDYLIDYFGKQYKRKFSKEEKDLLLKICGGHPYLIKSCSRLIALMDGQRLKISDLEKSLFSHFEPRSACQKIFDYRSHSEKNFLRGLIDGEKIRESPEEANTLAKLGLIKKDEAGFWVPFADFFRLAIEKGKEGLKPPRAVGVRLAFDEESGAILINGKNVEEKFTRQEYEILRFFLKEPNKLKSRDEIGEAMWGEESYDNYSNWAIDQVISKIRKKLKGSGVDSALVTVRGRGYKLLLS